MNRKPCSVKIGILAVLVGFTMLSGCALFEGLTIPETPEGKYLAGRQAFNKAVASYEAHYDLAEPEVQARWKEKIDPIVLTGFAALDGWALAIEEGELTEEWEAKLLAVKDRLIDLLFAEGIK